MTNERDLLNAMNGRMMTECGYNFLERLTTKGFTTEELREEVKSYMDSIVNGWKKGYKIAFLSPNTLESPKQRPQQFYFVESKGNLDDSELNSAARIILEKTIKQWRNSSMELAWIKIGPDGKNAEVRFPFRPEY
jgi:hypothetical protein